MESRPGKSEQDRRKIWRWWGLAMIIGGLALLVIAGGYYSYIRISQARYDPLVSTTQPTPIPTATAFPYAPTNTPSPSSPAVRIVIPAIGLDAKVDEIPSYNEVARFAVGHYPSANPGQAGNIVMAGHLRSDLLNQGDVFKHLPDIGKYVGITSYRDEAVRNPPSDPRPVYISLYDADGFEYRYQAVETLVVMPSAGWILDPLPEETLTLITCVPEFSYDFRFVVRAKRVS